MLTFVTGWYTLLVNFPIQLPDITAINNLELQYVYHDNKGTKATKIIENTHTYKRYSKHITANYIQPPDKGGQSIQIKYFQDNGRFKPLELKDFIFIISSECVTGTPISYDTLLSSNDWQKSRNLNAVLGYIKNNDKTIIKDLRNNTYILKDSLCDTTFKQISLLLKKYKYPTEWSDSAKFIDSLKPKYFVSISGYLDSLNNHDLSKLPGSEMEETLVEKYLEQTNNIERIEGEYNKKIIVNFLFLFNLIEEFKFDNRPQLTEIIINKFLRKFDEYSEKQKLINPNCGLDNFVKDNPNLFKLYCGLLCYVNKATMEKTEINTQKLENLIENAPDDKSFSGGNIIINTIFNNAMAMNCNPNIFDNIFKNDRYLKTWIEKVNVQKLQNNPIYLTYFENLKLLKRSGS